MKEFYHNEIGNNTAIIRCQNSDNEFDLYYHLYDNPIQHVWQDIHKFNKEIISKTPAESFEKVKQQLNDCCVAEKLNPIPDILTQEFLNWLHNEFVLQKNKNENWYLINDLIHILEDKLNNKFAEYDSTVKFCVKKEQVIPLKEEYKIFLNTDIVWGRMSLGYATLGKDWISIARNNDNVEDLAIQKIITSETQLSFCVEPALIGISEKRVYNWAKKTNFNVPLDNLNLMALGSYPLGQLIITESLLGYHNNVSDWYVPNHRCRLMWNKEVFNSTTIIKNVNFADTDLFWESLIKHGKTESITNKNA